MEITVNKNRVSKYFNLPALNQTERAEMLSKEDTFYSRTHTIINDAYIFGIEIEVENVPNPRVQYFNRPYWELTTDNSLRNNGVEFVSLPLKGYQVEAALKQLANSLPKEHQFSERTSVHIHMNVRDLTIEQIVNLMLIYTSLENLLFNWIGNDRDRNVFCIKLTETEYIQNYINLCTDTHRTVHHWNKYTALNILPIESKGTVEFRHMGGTIDIKRIITWINIITCMKTFAKKYTTTHLLELISNLNTNSQYEQYITEIFDTLSKEFLSPSISIKQLMETAISYVKLATLVTPNNTPAIYENDPQPNITNIRARTTRPRTPEEERVLTREEVRAAQRLFEQELELAAAQRPATPNQPAFAWGTTANQPRGTTR